MRWWSAREGTEEGELLVLSRTDFDDIMKTSLHVRQHLMELSSRRLRSRKVS
ncbi:MAG: hypothetical protein RDV48_21915 [Candidatus Eremiobacteraeota bacterium]|nr:hypothetical protein [Candidatus Eremiobacteraeota bacterium]